MKLLQNNESTLRLKIRNLELDLKKLEEEHKESKRVVLSYSYYSIAKTHKHSLCLTLGFSFKSWNYIFKFEISGSVSLESFHKVSIISSFVYVLSGILSTTQVK